MAREAHRKSSPALMVGSGVYKAGKCGSRELGSGEEDEGKSKGEEKGGGEGEGRLPGWWPEGK